MTSRGEGRSEIPAEIVREEVTVQSSDTTIKFDKIPAQVREEGGSWGKGGCEKRRGRGEGSGIRHAWGGVCVELHAVRWLAT